MDLEWIAKCAQLRDELEENDRLINEGIETLWNNLCGAIGAILERFQTYKHPNEIAEWSGAGEQEIWIKIGERLSTSATRMEQDANRVDLKLDRSKRAVSFDYAKQTQGEFRGSFSFGLNGDRRPCFLDKNGKHLSPSDVASKIMQPFLFPTVKYP